ncbi:MAG: DUF3006 domain-containing protein [Thermoleophilia bacterium]
MTPTDKLYYDRAEGDLAVIIFNGNEFSMPLALLPPEAREGDYLDLRITIDSAARSRAEDEIAGLQQRLREKNGGEQGD